MKKKIKSLTFYSNGNVMAYNDQGEDMPDIIAIGWMEIYFDRLLAMGYNPENISQIRARGHDGAWKDVIIEQNNEGSWNIDFKPISTT